MFAAEKRNGRIVFAKSDWNPLKLERAWRETLPAKLFAVLFDAIAAAHDKTCSAFPGIICDVAAEHLMYLTPGGEIFNAILTRLDNYTRAVRTREVGAVLSNYPVDFIGGGWDDFKAEFAEPVIGRASARPVGSIHPTTRAALSLP
jgi:hypothetical protein